MVTARGRLHPRRAGRTLTLVAMLAVMSLAATVAWTRPSSAVSLSMPDTNGSVYGLAHIGDTLYIGGSFTSVGGHARQNLAAIDMATGAVTGWNPGANSEVWGVTAAPNGGSVYVTGKFGRIGGERRVKVAQVDLAGRPTAFAAALGGGRGTTVTATAGAVYVGGRFTTVNGTARPYLAAVHPSTGSLLAFDARLDSQVWDVEVAPDGGVWVAGNFRAAGGLSRRGLAEVHPTTGQATAFNPAIRISLRDIAIGPTPDRVYVAGAGAGGRTIAYDTAPSAGQLLWAVHVDGDMQAVDANQSQVFSGGHPSGFYGGSPPVENTHSLDASSGALSGWGVTANGGKGAWEILVTPRGLWVAGEFDRIAGEPRGGLAFFPG